ncbi:hypothetical protein CASFOL_041890 [Castilleja foliolosa]|uniref:Dolichyl-diphosphooligosaccharide--protein glycosyltransferase subunit 4 n=1 Tax=Castilleja foliolosa TaxID=1961234 RepID=A0ABD3B9S4_9LAMI
MGFISQNYVRQIEKVNCSTNIQTAISKYRFHRKTFDYHFESSGPSIDVDSATQLQILQEMIDDQDLGFIANFLGIFIFGLVIAYHYVVADPKYEGV